MKNLLLLILLLFGFFIQAQNIELLHQANKCDLTFARTFSDEIAFGAKTKFLYLDTAVSANGSTCSFVYIKEGLSDVEKKSVEAYVYRYKTSGRYSFIDENCLCVDFKINKVGANPDLEIKGTEEYDFDVVKGKFLDLFPFYQKEIEPTATTEKTATTGIYSVRKDKEGYWYNFIREEGGWYLKNMSSRLN
ncbi:hypothetical protein [Flavobacterium sp. UBA6046]|jgi:hypothetical protein|uniref:hypothetical protein n=1 Tax=Flavobacterium sp. UBA6046 TaxID=1946552 RepID=UPI0025C611F6|nr:hypothetical protein [Flavobacterium sp. UBA6046]